MLNTVIMPFIKYKVSVATVGTWKLEIYIPTDCGTTTAKSVIMQRMGDQEG